MTTPRTKPASGEADLLARLGLPSGASSQDVETAHDELVAYLEKAPTELRPWARNQIATVDEAFAILSDPTIDRSPKVAVAAVAESVPMAVAASVATTEVDDEIEELELDHPATRQGRREVERQARAAARSGSAKQPAGIGRSGLVKRLAIGGAVVVGALAVGFIGFNMNGGTRVPGFSGSPAPEASAAGVDQAQLTALMQKIAADPKDTKSLQSIGDLYYQVGDYATAGTWFDKVLAVDPKNTDARLALGAAMYNQDKAAEAEKQWRQVIAVDPKSVEAYYDLGFLYLSQNPPDITKVRAEWNKVIEIEPNSDLAKRVITHLQSLEGSPAPSGGASGAPASAAPSIPAATPVPSK